MRVADRGVCGGYGTLAHSVVLRWLVEMEVGIAESMQYARRNEKEGPERFDRSIEVNVKGTKKGGVDCDG